MRSRVALTRQPPSTPTTSVTSVSSGASTAIATRRGITRKLAGSIDMISSASISSETFIVPSSAAMPAPTLAVRISAVMNGPISRHSPRPMIEAMRSVAPKRCSSMPVCSARIIPVKSATTSTTGSGRIPQV